MNQLFYSSFVTQNANEIWKTLSPVVCGSPYDETEHDGSRGNSDNIVPNLFEGSGESRLALEMMLYMLTHDPMVLYAPNGTDADKVINKVFCVIIVLYVIRMPKTR